jgi:hypothetical protein
MASREEEKTEKIQVLLSPDDFAELTKKISREALSAGEPPVSVSSYVRNLIRRKLGQSENQDKLVSDCIADLNLSPSMKDDIQSFIQSQQDLSDDMQTIPGVVMDPVARLNYNQVDNVQRFQY